jgi:hypothetical protein
MLSKLKKKSSEKIQNAKKNVSSKLNINKYNKWLFIFETILFVGVIDEYFEGLILSLNIDFYWHVLLLMISVGVLFTLLFRYIEPLTKKILVFLVRINTNKLVRIIMHIIILSILFYLYSQVFFGKTISIDFSFSVNAT